jgi:hypothetical protein
MPWKGGLIVTSAPEIRIFSIIAGTLKGERKRVH